MKQKSRTKKRKTTTELVEARGSYWLGTREYAYPSYEAVPEMLRRLYTREQLEAMGDVFPPDVDDVKPVAKENPEYKICVVCGMKFFRDYQHQSQWAAQVTCNKSHSTVLRNWMRGARGRVLYHDVQAFLSTIRYRLARRRWMNRHRENTDGI